MFGFLYHGGCDSCLHLRIWIRMCHRLLHRIQLLEQKGIEGFLTIITCFVELKLVCVFFFLSPHAISKSFPVSPCRWEFGGGEKQQPVIQYSNQRSYNRSAVAITRTYINTMLERIAFTYTFLVVYFFQ